LILSNGGTTSSDEESGVPEDGSALGETEEARKEGSAQEFVGRAGIAELGLNSQFADG
jgi:hypothetical protein